MGARPMRYITAFDRDPAEALRRLRARVFAEGAFEGAWRRPASIDQALENAGEFGTRSILDILSFSAAPRMATASPLSQREYDVNFGGAVPAVSDVLECDALWDDLKRGVMRIVEARQDAATVLVFVGYTFD